jgi:uncharacterized protein (UPF0297 family)
MKYGINMLSNHHILAFHIPKSLSNQNINISKNAYNLNNANNLYNKEILSNLQQEIDKSINKERESIINTPPILQTWKRVMKDVEEKNYNKAYSAILNSGDDIYLLRLLCLTGVNCVKNLSLDVSKQVLMRTNMISRSHQIQNLLMSLIQDSFDNSVFYNLNKNDQNEIMETLYEFSAINSKLGSNAAGLYTKIISSKNLN